MRVADGVACETDLGLLDATCVSPDRTQPHETTHKLSSLSPREADLLALAVRGLLDRATVPLARAAATFSDGYGWHEAGYARQSD
ncbi:MAG: hypothetical protein JSV80_13635, partial [Acidobacteriota bacterium]